jgi:hypothetical protein
LHYTPPRGFTNPFEKPEEKEKVKKPPAAKIPVAEKLSEGVAPA